MNITMLEALMLYSGAGFLFHKAWKLRDFSRCLPAVSLIIFGLAAWPFFVPMKVCWVMIYIVALVFLPILAYKGLLKKWNVIWVYFVLLTAIAVYFLVKLFFPKI